MWHDVVIFFSPMFRQLSKMLFAWFMNVYFIWFDTIHNPQYVIYVFFVGFWLFRRYSDDTMMTTDWLSMMCTTFNRHNKIANALNTRFSRLSWNKFRTHALTAYPNSSNSQPSYECVLLARSLRHVRRTCCFFSWFIKTSIADRKQRNKIERSQTLT